MSWWNVVAVLVASVAAFVGGHRLARAEGPRRTLGSGVLLAMLVASVLLRYRPELEVRWLPVEVYAHLRPWLSLVLAIAFLGSCLPQLPERRKRIAVAGMAVLLFALMGERAAATVGGNAALTGEPHPETGAVQQTSDYSCGAAAAATLLAQVGVDATEAEMAARCVTNKLTGTDEVGVVKGLREALGDRPYRVELQRMDGAAVTAETLPAMVATECSFLVGHWVVVVACDDEVVKVADPLKAANSPTGGIRLVQRERFEREFQGVAIRLVDEER